MADNILDWLMDHVIGWLLIVVLLVAGAFLLVGLPYLAYSAWRDSSAPTIELSKNEWACTHTQTVPVTTYVVSGKVMVPITTYSQRCDQWNRQP